MDTQLTFYYDSLSERTLNALAKNGIKTVQDLVNCSEEDFCEMRGIGEKGRQEIRSLLQSLGVSSSTFEPFGMLFSKRTANALFNNDIKTLQDLKELEANELTDLRGIGENGVLEITEALRVLEDDGLTDFRENALSQMTVTPKTPESLESWMHSVLDTRAIQILTEQFGLLSGEPVKAAAVADELEISRERVRQITNRAVDKMRSAILNGRIDPSIHQKLQTYARQKTRLLDIQGLSDVYNNSAMARLYAQATDEYYVYKNPRLDSEWLVNNKEEMDKLVETAYKWLSSQVTFASVAELSKQANVPESIFRDLAHTEIRDGKISIINGYRKDGVDRVKFIHEFMRRHVKPVSVHELAEHLGISAESVRSAILRVPGAVNVGRSIYALEEFGYTNKTSEELAIDYLREWGTPRPMNEIIDHVLRYREVNRNAVASAIYANPWEFTRFDNGYVALTEWGYKSDAKTRVVFDVSTREAVLSVLEEAITPMSNRDILEEIQKRYGNRATSSPVTVAAMTTELEKEGTIERLGTGTYYYRMKK